MAKQTLSEDGSGREGGFREGYYLCEGLGGVAAFFPHSIESIEGLCQADILGWGLALEATCRSNMRSLSLQRLGLCTGYYSFGLEYYKWYLISSYIIYS